MNEMTLQRIRAFASQAIKGIAAVIRQEQVIAPIEQDMAAEQLRLQEMTARYATELHTSTDNVARIFNKWRFINNLSLEEALERANNQDAGWVAYLHKEIEE